MLQILQPFPVLPTIFVDRTLLAHLEMEGHVEYLFEKIGLGKLHELQEHTYEEATRQFFATLKVDYEDKMFPGHGMILL